MSDDDLADLLLDELPAPERERVKRRLETDPEFRGAADRLSGVVNCLEALPPAAWAVALPGTDELATPPPRPVAAPPPRPLRPRWVARPVQVAMLAAATLAIGVVIGVAVERSNRSTTTTAQATPTLVVRLRPLAGEPGTATGTAAVSSGERLTLSVTRLPRTRTGSYYEAWLMTDTTHLVPLATFRVGRGGSARVALTLPLPADRYRYIDVSLQSAASGLAHSSLSVLRGLT